MPIFCYHHISGVKVIETGVVYAEEQVILCCFSDEVKFLGFLEVEKMKYFDFGHEIQLEDNKGLQKHTAIMDGIVLKSGFRVVGEIKGLSISSKMVSEEISNKLYFFDSEERYNEYCSSEKGVNIHAELFSDPDHYFLRRV